MPPRNSRRGNMPTTNLDCSRSNRKDYALLLEVNKHNNHNMETSKSLAWGRICIGKWKKTAKFSIQLPNTHDWELHRTTGPQDTPWNAWREQHEATTVKLCHKDMHCNIRWIDTQYRHMFSQNRKGRFWDVHLSNFNVRFGILVETLDDNCFLALSLGQKWLPNKTNFGVSIDLL